MKGVKQTLTQEIKTIFEIYGQDYCTRVTGIARTTLNTQADRYNCHKPNSNEVKQLMTAIIKEKLQTI